MRKRLLLAGLGAFVLLAAGGTVALPEQTPQQQIMQLKKQNRALSARNADLQDENAAQDDLLADQAATNARLRARLANQPDALDVILARDPDGLWQAMRAIWIAFPTLDSGALCGYDKSYVPADGISLTLTSWTFYKWAGC